VPRPGPVRGRRSPRRSPACARVATRSRPRPAGRPLRRACALARSERSDRSSRLMRKTTRPAFVHAPAELVAKLVQSRRRSLAVTAPRATALDGSRSAAPKKRTRTATAIASNRIPRIQLPAAKTTSAPSSRTQARTNVATGERTPKSRGGGTVYAIEPSASASPSRCPQFAQKFATAVFAEPQAGQARDSSVTPVFYTRGRGRNRRSLSRGTSVRRR
jgi:hypothetical protein